MDRITVNEFIEEVKRDCSPLKDGHDLGLIIDDTKGDSALMQALLSLIATRATCFDARIEDLDDPASLQEKLSGSDREETLILVHADAPLQPRHHAALQSLVYHHALEESNYRRTSRRQVSFGEQQRFVLVISREALESSWATYPLLKGILGTTLSCDGARKEDV